MAKAQRKPRADETAGQDSGRDMALDALAEAQLRAHMSGELALSPVAAIPYPMIDLPALRARLGLSQQGFADRFGFSLGALRNWEQGRRLPDRSARILLRFIEREPQTAAEIAAEMGA
ncbi:helix-turn-helix domain-containing protein [Rhodovulum euryhalinum]|uniref:Putative transcriptional regulator n=1 Tax=Rhodovulum euryhalinum TaxID=35805 RepID=A0A4R2KQR3_9RHOB|nr:helix-turn-helix domain-containing protein [Rhodovulum euryhalinum]TCO72478.1 putative transcriptional regulator [Rhodovulum euryhalinum]